MNKYTREEKSEYFKSLRTRWAQNKARAEGDEQARALYAEAPKGISYWSFTLTLYVMRALELEGLPYIDCKTFKGWKDTGFMVKKGEHAVIDGITWVGVSDDDSEDDTFVYPKVYKLFHRSQVEART